MNLNSLTIKQSQKKLQKGEISSVDLTRACLDRIEEVDGKLKACLKIVGDLAIKEAKAADKRRKDGEEGELLGIPYLAKDNILTKDVRTTAASKILENYIAPYDATIIKKLRSAGAVMLGKTNLDEFAHGASTENSAFGPTRNPWNLDRVPGGSSGGSAAAVSADMCIFALGTDTGGSIRFPAALCGVTGLKSTYGRGSRFGLISMTSSTDVPGPLAKTAEDAGIVEKIISGQDKNDSTTAANDFKFVLNKKIKDFKIGLPKEYFVDGTDTGAREAIEKAIKELEKMGAEFAEISLPHTKYVVPVYYIITPSEISSNLARFDGIKYGYSAVKDEKIKEEFQNLLEVYTRSRGIGFGPEAKRRIMLGTYALSAGYYDAYYLRAQKVRTKIKEEMDQALSGLDAILTPTSPHVAFKIGEQSNDPLKMYLEDIFVAGASLAGLPAVSIPCGFDNGLPVGLQLIGKRFDEAGILSLAHQYQSATEWHLQKPKI
jgi:aspartyl-tRNA(Asn)/glutamyl-tRNA(Gln) amidotransferase subunit A